MVVMAKLRTIFTSRRKRYGGTTAISTCAVTYGNGSDHDVTVALTSCNVIMSGMTNKS